MFITKLGNYPIILGRLWMKKYKIIINIKNNSLAFWPGHYIHIRATSLITLRPLSLPTEIVVIKIKEAITPQKIIKKGSKKT